MSVKAFDKVHEHVAFSCKALATKTKATYLEHRDQILLSDNSSICAAEIIDSFSDSSNG